MEILGFLFLALSLGGLLAIGVIFFMAWHERNNRPPRPSKPYRDWKD